MVDYIYKDEYIAVVADGTMPSFHLQPNKDNSGRGADSPGRGYTAGWYISAEELRDALTEYIDNGYRVEPLTVQVPISEIRDLRARLDKLEGSL